MREKRRNTGIEEGVKTGVEWIDEPRNITYCWATRS
jgi:hypothetical protein